MYAIGILPLIYHLENEDVKQTWFADDAIAGGSLTHLRTWWDRVTEAGPNYGYYPNVSKTWLIVKEKCLEEATALFEGTGISITAEGKRHLGAAIGNPTFKQQYVQNKISGWVKEIERLSTVANTQPQTAYTAFTHGVASRWTYLSRTIPDTAELFKPLEDAIRLQFIPSLTDQSPISDAMRELMALPVQLSGLGIANPSQSSTTQYNTSKLITSPLTSLIIEQSPSYSPETKMKQRRAKANARSSRRQRDTRTATELSNRDPKNYREQ